MCGNSKDIDTSHCFRKSLNDYNEINRDAEPTYQTNLICVSKVQGNNLKHTFLKVIFLEDNSYVFRIIIPYV